MRRTPSSAVIAVLVILTNASVALAAAPAKTGSGDPTQIGDNVKAIVSPNAKAFWWVFLVVGLLFMAASRKAGRAVATGIILVVSGVVIWNPAGATSMIAGLGDRIL